MEIKLTINGDDMNITKIETTTAENLTTVETPLTDWAAERAAKEAAYLAFLTSLKSELHTVLSTTHDYMSEQLEQNAGSDEWKELYTFTRQLGAIIDTVTIFQRHTYPPF